mgnify:FL=1
MAKQETIAQLNRKIERMEAQLQAAKEAADKNMRAYMDVLCVKVDLQIRLEQAIRILQGEE